MTGKPIADEQLIATLNEEALQHDKRSVVVFVHGFTSSSSCWVALLKRLSPDAELSKEHSFCCHDYDTRLFDFLPFRRIPSLRELGIELMGVLRSFKGCEELILVGHSQGGLVIQSYLNQMLECKEGRRLTQVRSVITIATPNFGSPLLSWLRSIVFRIWPNPQESTLVSLNAECGVLNRRMVRDVLHASRITETSCPIAFQAFWGLQDRVVPEASARGTVEEGGALPGNHSGVLRVKAEGDDARVNALKHAILRPVGHPSFHELESWEITLRVAPRDPSEPVRIGNRTFPGVDNVARRKMVVHVSDQNRCEAPFETHYRSKNGRVRSVNFTEPNEAAPEQLGANHDQEAREFHYCFRPVRGGVFKAELEIFNGFGQGSRDWHHHLEENLRAKELVVKLDLSAYLKAGYDPEKMVAIFRHDNKVTHDHHLCAEREDMLVLKPSEAGSGVWVWKMQHVRAGIVDLCWDLG